MVTDASKGLLDAVEYPSVMVGIPAYNEEKNIGWLVAAARKYADVVVVANDASKDKTAEIAAEAGALVVTHKFNQ